MTGKICAETRHAPPGVSQVREELIQGDLGNGQTMSTKQTRFFFPQLLSRGHRRRGEHIEKALHELREFQDEVKEDLSNGNPDLAALLVAGAQEILDTFKKSRPHRGVNEHDADDHD